MPQYLDRECRCPPNPYAGFDSVIGCELALKLSASLIVNDTEFCTMIEKDSLKALDELSLRDLLRGLDGKVGVYHIWRDEDFCDIHQRHNLQCVYVGKGAALTRLLDHTSDDRLEKDDDWLLDPDARKALEKRRAEDRKKKRERLRADEPYWISFFECENRVAKSIEQLFLDTYRFSVNTNENPGVEELWASWIDERYAIGTEIHAISRRKAPRDDVT
jgi:hypothetical protein